MKKDKEKALNLLKQKVNGECPNRVWLTTYEHLWTLTPYSKSSSGVLKEEGSDSSMYVENAQEVVFRDAVRPVVFLRNNVSLSVGTSSGEIGSKTNPYIVS